MFSTIRIWLHYKINKKELTCWYICVSIEHAWASFKICGPHLIELSYLLRFRCALLFLLLLLLLWARNGLHFSIVLHRIIIMSKYGICFRMQSKKIPNICKKMFPATLASFLYSWLCYNAFCSRLCCWVQVG